MMTTRIRKVGGSAVIDLTPEMLTMLGAKDGDAVLVLGRGDGHLEITIRDASARDALEAAEIVMDENQELLQNLASSGRTEVPRQP